MFYYLLTISTNVLLGLPVIGLQQWVDPRSFYDTIHKERTGTYLQFYNMRLDEFLFIKQFTIIFFAISSNIIEIACISILDKKIHLGMEKLRVI